MSRYRWMLALLILGMLLFPGCKDDDEDDDPPPGGPPTGSAGTFLEVGGLATARYGHTASSLLNGDVLVAGGRDSAGTILASAELYEYMEGTFSPTGNLIQARTGHTATVLTDGRVFVTGGADGTGPVAAAEIYSASAHAFTATAGQMLYPRTGHAAVLLSSGKVFIVGGISSSLVLAFAEVFDPATGTFTKTTGNLATARRWCTATLLDDGRILVAGGADQAGAALSSAEIYTPPPGNEAGGVFSPCEAMPAPAARHVAVKVPAGTEGGNVVILGGMTALSPDAPLGAVLVFDLDKYAPGEGFVTATAVPGASRDDHTLTLLTGGGAALVAGGTSPQFPELFTFYGTSGTSVAAEATFQRTQDGAGTPTWMTGVVTGRRLHTATFLPNGTVLLAGGMDGFTVLTSCEIFNP